MKKILILLLTFIPCTSWVRAAQGVTFVLHDSQRVSFLFSERPVVVTRAGGVVVSVGGTERLSCPYSEVRSICFEENVPDGVSLTKEKVGGNVTFRFSRQGVVATGLSPYEAVYVSNSAGVLVLQAKADQDGTLAVRLDALPKGTYLVTTQSKVACKVYNNE